MCSAMAVSCAYQLPAAHAGGDGGKASRGIALGQGSEYLPLTSPSLQRVWAPWNVARRGKLRRTVWGVYRVASADSPRRRARSGAGSELF